MLRIFWRNVGLLCPTKLFGVGVINLGQCTLDRSKNAEVHLATPGIWMRFILWLFEANGDTYGAPLIRKACPSEASAFGMAVLDILVQKRKDKKAAERFFKKLMKGQGRSAREIVTDKLLWGAN